MRVTYRGCKKVRVSGVASAKGRVLALDHGRELHELLAREAARLRVVVPPHNPLRFRNVLLIVDCVPHCTLCIVLFLIVYFALCSFYCAYLIAHLLCIVCFSVCRIQG